MTSTGTRTALRHSPDDSDNVGRVALSFSPNPKRRKVTMTSFAPQQFSYEAIINTTVSEQVNLIEQLTPENPLSSVPTVLPRPFTFSQFEQEDLRNKPQTETWITDSLSVLLERTCEANKFIPSAADGKGPYRSEKYPDGSSSIFFSLKKPSIILRSYILRLVRYMRVSKSVFVVALVYLDRLRHEDKLLSLNHLNVHRLLTTALALAAKYLEDESHRNSTIARIGGVPTTVEMNMLELQFLRRMGWNCAVSEVAYDTYEWTAFGPHPRIMSGDLTEKFI